MSYDLHPPPAPFAKSILVNKQDWLSRTRRPEDERAHAPHADGDDEDGARGDEARDLRRAGAEALEARQASGERRQRRAGRAAARRAEEERVLEEAQQQPLLERPRDQSQPRALHVSERRFVAPG